MIGTRSARTQSALFAGQYSAKRMPFFMCTMCIAAAATASTILIGTGVLAPVSLFVLLLIVCLLLLVSLLVLSSLILSGLTGFIGLVGLTKASATQGD